MGFLGVSDGEESACNAGDPGSIPGLGGAPGEKEWLPTYIFIKYIYIYIYIYIERERERETGYRRFIPRNYLNNFYRKYYF